MKKTPLHQAHIDLGAKMGEFAGYDMPLFYPDGVMKEHEWVRAHAGLFDVSHMGQVTLEGPGVVAFLQTITPSSFEKLAAGRAKYTVMTNEAGGIVDDLIITRCGEQSFFCVINAGCKDKDVAWVEKNLPGDVTLKRHDDYALIALQGPSAEAAVKAVLDLDLSALPYMAMEKHGAFYVSRLGYTGEDGFEISLPAAQATEIWNRLLGHADVKPIGLAARDSLRLEMGYCLYGHDIDAVTTPLEAGLGWVMGKTNSGYIGAPAIKNPPPRLRVGIRLLDKGVAREGAVILSGDGHTIGTLTSGGFSPTLKESIGQGYVPAHHAAPGTKILVDVRGRRIPAEVVRMPFVQARTKKAG